MTTAPEKADATTPDTVKTVSGVWASAFSGAVVMPG